MTEQPQLIYYAVRHKETKEIMPLLERNKGYSWWNPSKDEHLTHKSVGIPRLFRSERNAGAAIAAWASMPNASMKGSTSYWGEEDYDLDIKDDGRKKEELEIVAVKVEVL